MKKKHRIAKYIRLSPQNCAILEYLGGNNSEVINQALALYFKKKLKLSQDEISLALERYMERHYQLPLFKEELTESDKLNDNTLSLE